MEKREREKEKKKKKEKEQGKKKIYLCKSTIINKFLFIFNLIWLFICMWKS